MNPPTDRKPPTLPEPVSRYFARVLAEHQRPIRSVRMHQTGQLRADPHRQRWMSFSATEVVRPCPRSFSWDAEIRLLPLVQLRVRDAYADGVGTGQVRWMSMTVAADRDRPELNAAALHRYLAEAVWYPTALLPAAGVQWRALDAYSAVATLSDSGITVDLEFRFNAAAEVVSVYTTGRWCRTGKRYTLRPWEGRFGAYRRHRGLLVPSRGEVGWHVGGQLEIVWKGEIDSIEYTFDVQAPAEI
jgi:hypothetical protein